MKILGINISHHSSSCLLEDGKIVYFIEDERINRIKHYLIDEHDHRSLSDGLYEPYFINKLKSYTSHVDCIIFSSFGRESHRTELNSDESIIRSYLKAFENKGISFDHLYFSKDEHHLYHAANAFYASGFDDAVCLVMDGGGSLYNNLNNNFDILGSSNNQWIIREVESIYEFSYDSPFKKLMKMFCPTQKFPQFRSREDYDNLLLSDAEALFFIDDNDIIASTLSAGIMFNDLCNKLGFDSGKDAGKLMGLAPYAKECIDEELYDFEKVDWFANVKGFSITSIEISNILESESFFNLFRRDNFDEDFQIKTRISKKLHDECLKHTNYLIQKCLELSSFRNIVISGGYALNCLNNYLYLDNLPEDVKIYIDPIANDAGTALGAAKYLWYKLTKSKEKYPLTDLYLG